MPSSNDALAFFLALFSSGFYYGKDNNAGQKKAKQNVSTEKMAGLERIQRR